MARLVGIAPGQEPVFGSDRGSVVLHGDFDAPLPDDVAASFGS